uniref:Uncharacterized protein n=1 Tax=viral metagenome TaxID=1070528 RepID=A0A6M3XYC2_9ZZZZ
MKKWEPKDVIAVVVVVGAIALLWQGIDTIVGFTLLGIVAAYYGIDLTPWLKVGRNQGKEKEE